MWGIFPIMCYRRGTENVNKLFHVLELASVYEHGLLYGPTKYLGSNIARV